MQVANRLWGGGSRAAVRLWTILTVLLVTFLPRQACGRLIMAAGGSPAQLQTAVNMARQGDTVKIPAGEFSYQPIEAINVTRGITLLGSGQQATLIHKLGTQGKAWEPAIRVWGGAVEGFELAELTITGSAPLSSPGILLADGCRDFRLHHLTLRRCAESAIDIRGEARGVVDHCTFIDNCNYGVVVYGPGESAWIRALRLGTAEAVFVEDNHFVQADVPDKRRVHHIASNNGSHYVFRHNTIEDGNLGSQAIDAHGYDHWPRGSRCYEIYANTVRAEHRWVGINIRGGDGVIFDNRFTGEFVSPIFLQNYQCRDQSPPPAYPAKDQITDLYIWDNTYNGRPFEVFVLDSGWIKPGRDFYLKPRPGYTPYRYPHPLVVGCAGEAAYGGWRVRLRREECSGQGWGAA